MKTVLYVSDCRINFSHAEIEVADIVECSRRWNESVGITGALVFTEQHFVQFIEGKASAIDDLLRKLRVDPRHTNMTIIEAAYSDHRHFDGWGLAYSGPDDFIDRRLRTILRTNTTGCHGATAAGLRSLMLRMASHNV